MSRTPVLDSILLPSCKSLTQEKKEKHHYLNMQSDYWNIEDILAEEEMISCVFPDDTKKLGFLNHLDKNNSNVSTGASNKKSFGASKNIN